MATTRKTTAPKRKSTSAGRKTRSAAPRATRSTAPIQDKDMTETPAPVAADPVDATAPVAEATTPPASDATTEPEPEPFRRPDLIQAVADRTELKRNDAKMVLELVLEELGKALDKGDELVLQPLGKLSVKKRRDAGGGEILTVKLKRSAVAQKAAEETPLADPATDS